MKLNDDDQNGIQTTAAILNAFLWGLVVVFPFIQVSELDSKYPLSHSDLIITLMLYIVFSWLKATTSLLPLTRIEN